MSRSELVVEPTRTILLFSMVLSYLQSGGTTELGTVLFGTIVRFVVELIELSFLFFDIVSFAFFVLFFIYEGEGPSRLYLDLRSATPRLLGLSLALPIAI